MFHSDSDNMFNSDSVNIFTRSHANIYTSDHTSANMFTSTSANMFLSDLANMFISDLGNMFISASANMFTSASANIFTSDLANTFTSDLANMFTRKLEKYKKWFGQHVPWWSWLVNMLALYQEYDTWSETVYILGNSIGKKLNGFLLTWKLNQKCLVKFDSLIRPRWDACTTMRNQLFEILTWTTLYYIVWLLVEHPVRSLERLYTLHVH